MTRIFTSPAAYIQGPGALSGLAGRLGAYGARALVLSNASGIERVGGRLQRDFAAAGVALTLETFGGECTVGEVARLADVARAAEVDAVAGIGGGKVLDTAKALAYELRAPVAVCPTAASSDAPTSACAVLYTDEGVLDRYLSLRSNPDLVLVDSTIVAAAPPRLIVAGMGDALSTYFEARAASTTRRAAGGPVAATAGRAIARLCWETLEARGIEAARDVREGRLTEAVEDIIETNTLLSGIGFETCGLAAAHAIHNGLTRLPETRGSLHGEKVAFGTLAQLELEGADEEERARVLAFCRAVGLPTTLDALGITDTTPAHLMAAAEGACKPGSDMEHMSWEVRPEDVVAAMLAADTRGRAAAEAAE